MFSVSRCIDKPDLAEAALKYFMQSQLDSDTH